MMFEILLITNILASAFMTGLIWFVQLVHYPGFELIEVSNFTVFHRFHVPRTGLVVIPPMLAELGSSLWLVIAYDQLWLLNALGLSLLIGIWVSTFALQARYHQKLQQELSPQLVSRLVTTNWIRTVLWTTKSGFSAYILVKLLSI